MPTRMQTLEAERDSARADRDGHRIALRELESTFAAECAAHAMTKAALEDANAALLRIAQGVKQVRGPSDLLALFHHVRSCCSEVKL